MFKIRLYLYDSTQESNGYRGADLSKYVLQGQQYTEDITEVLDTSEITLAGFPQKESFAPETKFIADIVEFNELNEISTTTVHLCVANDTPSQPIMSDDTYFDHHISFIEPSVVAQKRLVDNISTTYKLKDVSLQEVPAFPDTNSYINILSSIYTPQRNFGVEQKVVNSPTPSYPTNRKIYTHCTSGKYFQVEGDILLENSQGQQTNRTYSNIEFFKNGDNYIANFIIPKLAIMYGNYDNQTFSKIGYASIVAKIEEFSLNDELNPTNQWSKTFISNSNLGNGKEYLYSSDIAGNKRGWRDIVNGEWLVEQVDKNWACKFKKYTDKSANEPDYRIENIPIKVDRKYVVTISLYQFADNFSVGGFNWSKYTGSQPSYYSDYYLYEQVLESSDGYINSFFDDTPSTLLFTAQQTSGNTSFTTYDVDTATIVYASSTPYSALALLQKAIINSSLYEKENGVYIADVNQSKLPFYIDDKFVDELSDTLIIENFYNQKNLWQIMIEVGNYIHAIPELKFGSDDRFIITFNKLGRTDEQVDKAEKGTKISIFNSRSVEDYISATSSYITNMVQLGGYIEEWVTPKTTNEQLLVYNDTAELILSKPIIELLNIKVRRNSDGAIVDMTDYIYEENVYKTLSLDYQVIPNRGIAMYYSLGNNVITGGQYQLPQADIAGKSIYGDYAFKKIIYSAFNGYPVISPAPISDYWSNIDVKDYTFYVRYRTKDSVRQNHIRPDLRKYLLNTKYDRYPEHNQFNNQQDVVVDSIKFGNNMFGKLIKTGNNSYDIWEWHTALNDLKHKGELYRINDELYYVAKVTHYIYSSYILSKVSYSKDYNELSNIIGIPSEPRFYEISEQSLIWRELAINDILYLTDDPTQLEYKSNYMFNYDHLADLILGSGTDFAKYAVTVFKGDKDADQYDQTVGEKDTYIEVLNPINAYSSENTLTYEWDMADNYSAGDKVIDTDKAEYNSLRAVGYTDVYGKAPLLDFYIIEDLKTPPTASEIKGFPESPISTKQGETRPFIGDYDILATNVKNYDTDFNGRGIGLLKDCREAISINFNLQMAVNSDTFVLSPYVYLPKKSNLKLVLLADEVNKLSTGYIDNSAIITPLDKDGNTMSQYFDFTPIKTQTQNSWDNTKQVTSQFSIDLASILANVNDKHFTGADNFQRIKSIAILCDVSLDAGIDTSVSSIPYKTQFVVARNIPEFWDRAKATSSWLWGSPKKSEIFKNKQ